MIPVHKNRFIIDRIAGYWATVLDDYPESSSFRKSIYFMEGVLIGIFFFYGWNSLKWESFIIGSIR